jgi:hypothetical protein
MYISYVKDYEVNQHESLLPPIFNEFPYTNDTTEVRKNNWKVHHRGAVAYKVAQDIAAILRCQVEVKQPTENETKALQVLEAFYIHHNFNNSRGEKTGIVIDFDITDYIRTFFISVSFRITAYKTLKDRQKVTAKNHSQTSPSPCATPESGRFEAVSKLTNPFADYSSVNHETFAGTARSFATSSSSSHDPSTHQNKKQKK